MSAFWTSPQQTKSLCSCRVTSARVGLCPWCLSARVHFLRNLSLLQFVLGAVVGWGVRTVSVARIYFFFLFVGGLCKFLRR